MKTKQSIHSEYDKPLTEEQYTDTSMFNADEIVSKVEEFASQRKATDNDLSARQRYELLKEEKRLQAELEEYGDGH